MLIIIYYNNTDISFEFGFICVWVMVFLAVPHRMHIYTVLWWGDVGGIVVIPAPAETCPGFATWAKRMMTLQELWGSNPGN